MNKRLAMKVAKATTNRNHMITALKELPLTKTQFIEILLRYGR